MYPFFYIYKKKDVSIHGAIFLFEMMVVDLGPVMI